MCSQISMYSRMIPRHYLHRLQKYLPDTRRFYVQNKKEEIEKMFLKYDLKVLRIEGPIIWGRQDLQCEVQLIAFPSKKTCVTVEQPALGERYKLKIKPNNVEEFKGLLSHHIPEHESNLIPVTQTTFSSFFLLDPSFLENLSNYIKKKEATLHIDVDETLIENFFKQKKLVNWEWNEEVIDVVKQFSPNCKNVIIQTAACVSLHFTKLQELPFPISKIYTRESLEEYNNEYRKKCIKNSDFDIVIDDKLDIWSISATKPCVFIHPQKKTDGKLEITVHLYNITREEIIKGGTLF